MRALILANGLPPSAALLKRLHAEADLFLATDGAANHLVTLDLIPHVILGDFDSIAFDSTAFDSTAIDSTAFDSTAIDSTAFDSTAFDSIAEEFRARLYSAELIHTPDQEASDLDKALEYLAERGAQRVTITGSSGGRVDHSLTTISLLFKYGDRLDLRIIEDDCELHLLSRDVVIEGREGDTVSIVVFDAVHGVTTEGLSWRLNDATLYPGSRGVSNRLAASNARIAIREGRAVVCHLRASS